MATKKLSEALLALTTPEFGFEVEMPSISLNGTSVTATGAELNFVDGVTSNIQTQLGNKADAAHTQSGATITTDDSIVSTRYPLFTSTTRGAVPLSTTQLGTQVLADNAWIKIGDLYQGFYALTYASPTTTWNLTTMSYNATLTLTGDTALDIVGEATGCSGCIIVTQGVGSSSITLPANSYLLGASTLTLSSAIGAVDILTFVYNGSNYYWSLGANYMLVP